MRHVFKIVVRFFLSIYRKLRAHSHIVFSSVFHRPIKFHVCTTSNWLKSIWRNGHKIPNRLIFTLLKGKSLFFFLKNRFSYFAFVLFNLHTTQYSSSYERDKRSIALFYLRKIENSTFELEVASCDNVTCCCYV